MARSNDFRIAPNFMLWEFNSPDIQAVKIDPRLVGMLQALRDRVAAPINVTSGFRTVKRNKAVDGVKGSLHLIGKAADIWCPTKKPRSLATHARAVGFPAVGIYTAKGFIHVDLGKARSWGS